VDLGENYFLLEQKQRWWSWEVFQFALVLLVTEEHPCAGPGAEMGSTHFA